MSPSIVRVLLLVQRRPEMYLSHDSSARGRQLDALEGLLAGYTLCLHQRGLPNEEPAMIAKLEDYMRARVSASGPPIRAVRAASATDDEAWARVWESISAFATAHVIQQ